MTRRQFLSATALGMGFACTQGWSRFLPTIKGRRPLRFAVITDLHHGLAPDAMLRLQAFCDEVRKRPELDAVIQLGDFNYSKPESKECIDLFTGLPQRKIHVLGNHDMDLFDKDTVQKFWGMPSRFGYQDIGDYRFVTLDLNHYVKDGKMVAYDKGNYFTSNASHNWADPVQTHWLRRVLLKSDRPCILLSHQPIGFGVPGEPLAPEQREILDLVEEARKANAKGSAVLAISGHMHVDRVEKHGGLTCLSINSASYFWHGGMHPYTKPLFAFLELGDDGVLKVEGVLGAFVKPPPATSDPIAGRSASIANRHLTL